jgi:hypothetical protein
MRDVHFLPNVSLLVKIEAPASIVEEPQTHEQPENIVNEIQISDDEDHDMNQDSVSLKYYLAKNKIKIKDTKPD